jgi:hypothetical protein
MRSGARPSSLQANKHCYPDQQEPDPITVIKQAELLRGDGEEEKQLT